MPKKKTASDDDLIDETPGIGHNSNNAELSRVVDYVEALLDQRRNINEDIREAMETAKLKGLDKRTINEMIKLRALDKGERDKREELRDQYLVALGLAD